VAVRYGWSLDKNEWNKLREKLTSVEWKRTFLENDYRATVPNTAGVYLICVSTSEIPIFGRVMQELYNAIYVGQSKNLKGRFAQHVRGYGRVKPAISIFRRLHFWYAEVAPDGLDDIEQLLLDAFGPPANDKNVKAKIGSPVPAGRN
jgi:hypothetical protein